MNIMHASVKLYMIEVILLLSLWAHRFFKINILIDCFSQNSNVYTKNYSRRRCKLNEINVRPAIMPIKITKKISRSKPRLSVSTERGNKK